MRQILVTAVVFGLFSPLAVGQMTAAELAEEIRIYQKGDQFEVRHLTAADRQDPIRKRALEATVMVNGASGIYLGKFNGQHVVATNAHVATSDFGSCEQSPPKVLFQQLGMWSTSTACLGAWPDIELALITVKPYDPNTINEEEYYYDEPSTRAYATGEAAVNGKGINFAYNKIPEVGTPLLNVGYGIGGNDNPERDNPVVLIDPRISEDQDCRVLSKTGEFRFLFDPDTINPLNYSAWSFAHTCEASHGSSGSMIMNRQTGEILGLVWTGVWTKAGGRPISSAEIANLEMTQSEGVWNQLEYAVPAVKIKEYLLTQIKAKKIKGKNAKLIKAVLGVK